MLLLLAPAFAGVLVNEVYYDPAPEADGGNEWIELCNNGTETVDLTGWTIESGGTDFATSFTLGTLSIAPGAYVVIGGNVADLTGEFKPSNLQNGGSETDGIRILTVEGAVVDTVLYDTDPNDNGLTDDAGLTTSAAAPDVAGGHSVGRWNGVADCTDTDVSGADFVDYDTPSPGAVNPDAAPVDTGDTGGGVTADCSAIADIRLNELISNVAGVDDGLEWVELYNRGSAAVNVSEWIVRGASKSTGGNDALLPEETWIEPLAFLLVGAGGIVDNGDLSLGNGTGADGVYLLCGGAVVDSVVYGDPNSDALLDDSGLPATSLAEIPSEDVSLARRVDGGDSDLSAADWVSSSENTPGGPNSTPQCDLTGAAGLKVNELLYDPDGADGGAEFIELVNVGTDTINLEGFIVQYATSAWKDGEVLAKGTTLAPGAFFVIGGPNVENVDLESSLSPGNGTDGDGVRVNDCAGTVLDTVLYGGEEGDGLTGDGGATDVVDKAASASSIGRYPDGADADLHTDWHAYAAPSPGEANADPGAKPIDTGNGGNGGDDTGAPSDGCAPKTDRPAGAECNTSSLPLRGMEFLAAAFALARRRKA